MSFIKPTAPAKLLAPNVHEVLFPDERKLILIGTAHVSQSSVELVESQIAEHRPDVVAIELDSDRLKALEDANQFKNLDIIKVIRSGQGFMLAAHIMLSSFQKKIAEKTGSRPGGEFVAAVKLARSSGAVLVLADRPVRITLKRAWNMAGIVGQAKLISSVFAGGDDKEISVETIEALKETDALGNMMEELGKALPQIKKVLIDERDVYLAEHIRRGLGKTTVAIVGAGHVPGLLAALETEITDATLQEFETIPEPSFFWKMAPWLIPLLLVAPIVWGFVHGNMSIGVKAIGLWLASNMGMAGLGAMVALGHPLTILSAILFAPLATLHPAIGIGMIAAVVEAWIRKPRVADFETVQEASGSLKGWYQNRLTRILLVFIFSSLGGALGNIAVLPFLLRTFGTH
jgi:pheromone shutdown-related protein TraB